MQGKNHHHYIIIGAGPAGLQMGYFLKKNNRDYIIIEGSDQPGSFFEKFPRHKALLTMNKRFTGYEDKERRLRYDWNSLLSDSPSMEFRHYSKRYLPNNDEYQAYLVDFARYFSLSIHYNITIEKISMQDKTFHLADDRGSIYTCSVLIIATGVTKPVPHTNRCIILGNGRSPMQ